MHQRAYICEAGRPPVALEQHSRRQAIGIVTSTLKCHSVLSGQHWSRPLIMSPLPVQAMRLKHGMRFRMMAVGLKMAGHKKVADMITSSWKVRPSAVNSHPFHTL